LPVRQAQGLPDDHEAEGHEGDLLALARRGIGFRMKTAYPDGKDRVYFNAGRIRGGAMEFVRITARGKITIPARIMKRLGVKDGGKAVFIEGNGRVIMENASKIAPKTAQDAFSGEAPRPGLKTEQDVVDMIKEVRREIRKESGARDG
jgi:bifunctional DNA-binding transcriptional regulator/antitoxin component of YhaV-PrlF toxin-antitoxin module